MYSEATKDDTFFVNCLYNHVLGREPDEKGLRFWEDYEPRSNLVAAFMAEASKELAARA